MSAMETMLINLLKAAGVNVPELMADAQKRIGEFEKNVSVLNENIAEINNRLGRMENHLGVSTDGTVPGPTEYKPASVSLGAGGNVDGGGNRADGG